MEGTLMQTAMYTTAPAAPVSALRVWAGRSISALVILFMVFDGITKALQVPSVVEASAQFGFTAAMTFGIGIIALICVGAYALPRTAPFGALLLTGYLGGAVATQVHTGAAAFSLVFPVMLGALAWGGLALRDPRVRALISR
jgi:hypothetical protein